MKKALLSLFLSLPLLAGAQSILNPGFEDWTNITYDDPVGWASSNQFATQIGALPNVSKVPSAITNTGVRLESVAATGTDVLPGLIWNGGSLDPEDALDGYGGVPFSQKPTTLTGNFRYNIPSAANASIILLFKNSGSVICEDTIHLTGSVPNFLVMNYALPHITAATTIPDSVIIFVGTHELDLSGPVGAWIEIDNMQLTGPGVTQTIDGSFDAWTTHSEWDVDDWQKDGNVDTSFDAFAGTYAARLMSVNNGSWIEYGSLRQDITLAQTVDTLVGYYKYTTKTNDSALIDITVSFSGPPTTITKHLGPAATYTEFKIPLVSGTGSLGTTLEIYSSSYMLGMPGDSSTLWIDSLMIKPQFVGVDDIATSEKDVKVYPNPAADLLQIDVSKLKTSVIEIAIYNATGSVVYRNTVKVQGGKEATVPVRQLAAGLYIYEIKAGETLVKGRFVKE